MPPEPQQPTPEEKKPDAAPEVALHRAHTFEDDMALAMDATDPKVIQLMIEQGREKEQSATEQEKRKRQRRSYTLFALIFCILAVVAAAYGYLHYRKLTVPLERTISVGVFPQTEPIVAQTTDIRQLYKTETTNTTLLEKKPTLLNIVADEKTLAPLSVEQFFRFIEAGASEPFQHMIDSIRLGMMNTGDEVSPFVILSVRDPEVATKEFLIAEPDLVHLFYTALGIDLGSMEAGQGFESKYLYNLPVRTLSVQDSNGKDQLVLLYGYAADNVIVITTKPAVLKEIYDTIVSQQ